MKWCGKDVDIQKRWVRITQNPKTYNTYPGAGDVIKLAGHRYLPNGEYLVTSVVEYEPPYTRDDDGRDIRISLFPDISNPVFRVETLGWCGEEILKAMVT